MGGGRAHSRNGSSKGHASGPHAETGQTAWEVSEGSSLPSCAPAPVLASASSSAPWFSVVKTFDPTGRTKSENPISVLRKPVHYSFAVKTTEHLPGRYELLDGGCWWRPLPIQPAIVVCRPVDSFDTRFRKHRQAALEFFQVRPGQNGSDSGGRATTGF
jgi:hypothetical protein